MFKRAKAMKFFYLDPEGDIVSVSSTEDLVEAYACFPNEKICYLTLVEEVVPERVQATLEQSQIALDRLEEEAPKVWSEEEGVLGKSEMEAPEEVEKGVECPKCEGSKTSKHGGACRRCNGTGRLEGSFIEEVHQFIQAKAGDYSKQVFAELYSQHKQQKKERQAKVLHHNVICDRCEVSPIQGVRYHCVVCHDFDLCASCEAAHVHSQHPFLKVLHPSQMPLSITCTLPASPAEQHMSEHKVEQPKTEAKLQ